MSTNDITVTIKTITGTDLVVPNIDPTGQCSQFKLNVYRKLGIPTQQQKLIYLGKNLADEDIVQEVGIKDGHQLHLVLTLRGG